MGGVVRVGFVSFILGREYLVEPDQGSQLAIIDAFKGNSSKPLLRMEDHITVKQDKAAFRARAPPHREESGQQMKRSCQMLHNSWKA
eukprot:4423152-Amphidinium_carterae.1